MMEYMILGSHAKVFSVSTKSFETLHLFDYERDRSKSYFSFNNETQEITLSERGMYKFEFFSQLQAEGEQVIKFRLNIDGITGTEYNNNIGTDQTFTQIVTVQMDDPDIPSVVIIEVMATVGGDKSSNGNDYLIITKIK